MRARLHQLAHVPEAKAAPQLLILAEPLLREALAGRPVYLCFDMDFFDPSCAPGVCTPTWGGATARRRR